MAYLEIFDADIGEEEKEIEVSPLKLPERRPQEQPTPVQPIPEREREEPLVPA